MVLPHLFYCLDPVSYDFWLNSAVKKAQNECRFNSRHITKKPFSSVLRYIILWRHLWRYCINANMKTWYPQKPNIPTFTLIPSSFFFSDHCVKLYGWMCITFQMPLVHVHHLSSVVCQIKARSANPLGGGERISISVWLQCGIIYTWWFRFMINWLDKHDSDSKQCLTKR